MLSIIISTLKRMWNAPVHYEVEVCRSFLEMEPKYAPFCNDPIALSDGDRLSGDWRDVNCEQCLALKPIYYYEVDDETN